MFRNISTKIYAKMEKVSEDTEISDAAVKESSGEKREVL